VITNLWSQINVVTNLWSQN